MTIQDMKKLNRNKTNDFHTLLHSEFDSECGNFTFSVLKDGENCGKKDQCFFDSSRICHHLSNCFDNLSRSSNTMEYNRLYLDFPGP